MPPQNRKSVSIQYRRLSNSINLNGQAFHQVISSALNRQVNGISLIDDWHLRIWERQDDSLVANRITPPGQDYVFGDLTHYKRGTLQALLDADTTPRPSAEISQMGPPQRYEFINSLMHWMIKGPHAFIIQSQTLKTDTLEEYLTWLLSPVMGQQTSIILDSQFDQEAVGGDLADIKSITVGRVLGVAPVEPQEELNVPPENAIPDQTVNRTFTRRPGWQKVREILRSVFDPPTEVDTIMEDIPQDTELRLDVNMSYKTRGRREERRAMMRRLQHGLRNIDDNLIQATGRDGKMLKNGSIKLQYPARINLRPVNGDRESVLLDPEDVFRAMNEAYNSFLANGRIEA